MPRSNRLRFLLCHLLQIIRFNIKLFFNANTACSICNSRLILVNFIYLIFFFFSKQKWDIELNIACVYEDMAACLTNEPCLKLQEVIPIALIKPRCQKVPLCAEKRALCQLKIWMWRSSDLPNSTQISLAKAVLNEFKECIPTLLTLALSFFIMVFATF